jgi:hypothetical protein
MALSPELVEQLRSLSPDQKLEAMNILSERMPGLQAGTDFEVWSPYDSADAAALLMKALYDEDDEGV